MIFIYYTHHTLYRNYSLMKKNMNKLTKGMVSELFNPFVRHENYVFGLMSRSAFKTRSGIPKAVKQKFFVFFFL
jgi:hypothetical protein